VVFVESRRHAIYGYQLGHMRDLERVSENLHAAHAPTRGESQIV